MAVVGWANTHRFFPIYHIIMLNPGFLALQKISRFYIGLLCGTYCHLVFGLCSLKVILTSIGIIISKIFELFRFFSLVQVSEFLFGLIWNLQFEGAERAGSEQMELATYDSITLFGVLC